MPKSEDQSEVKEVSQAMQIRDVVVRITERAQGNLNGIFNAAEVLGVGVPTAMSTEPELDISGLLPNLYHDLGAIEGLLIECGKCLESIHSALD